MGVLHIGQLWRFWPLFAIVGGLVNLTVPGRRMWGVILIVFGALLQASVLGVFHFDWSDMWPIVLITAGAAIIWNTLNTRSGGDTSDPRTTLNETAVFGGIERRVSSQDFRGGQMNAIFGGIELDLREAQMQVDEAELTVNTTFGGISIRVPQTWMVVSRGQGIFGGFNNDTHLVNGNDPTAKRKTLIIRGTAVLGGVEIKN
jgi:predicted membrane protein